MKKVIDIVATWNYTVLVQQDAAKHFTALDTPPPVWYSIHSTGKGGELVAFNQGKYANEYKRTNYDVVRALVPKGCGKVIKEEAAIRGKSVSQFLVEAVEYTYKLDLSKGNGG